jgi:YfiH family protein
MTTEPATPSGAAGFVAAGSNGPVRWLFSTRAGGGSPPPFDSLNLGGSVGDDPARVQANRARLAASAGLAADRVVWMRQVHGTTVTRVGDGGEPWGGNDAGGVGRDLGSGSDGNHSDRSHSDRSHSDHGDGEGGHTGRGSRPSIDLPESDGVLTTVPGIGLAVLVADCIPILAADPSAGVIAAVHAGRRGAAGGIAVRTLEQMTLAGAVVDRVEIQLGPSICGACYEVPAALRDEVEANLPGSASTTSWGTPSLDLRAGVARQLNALGVAHVRVDDRCTFTDPALFSHRRSAPTGRFAGLIWMPA